MIARTVRLVCFAAMLAGCMVNQRPLQFLAGEGPTYPAEARERGIEGWVLVRYDVTVDGEVIEPTVVQADPPGVFDRAAVEAVSAWRYKAPIVDGEPRVTHGVESRVTFKLGDPDEYASH